MPEKPPIYLEKVYISICGIDPESIAREVKNAIETLNLYEFVASIHVEDGILAIKTYDFKCTKVDNGKPFGYILRSIRTVNGDEYNRFNAETKV